MNTTPKKKPALYSDAMDDALVEYVKQDIAGFANRYYDTGKFLFTVSSFAILATLTIHTTFGNSYNIILFALIFFLFCLLPSYSLTVGIDYKTKTTNTILEEYQAKKRWMDKHLKRWFISFVLGCSILAFAFVFVVLTSGGGAAKPEAILQEINRNIEDIKEEIRTDIQSSKVYQPTCSLDDIAQVKVLLSDLYVLVDSHSAKSEALFSNVDSHLDRHLDIMANKISKACSD
ncbi:hypothetical protein [Vibrio ordalii]|uniref:Uncharacterized protein n=1 Tax=Vibrio ordalii FS-238 TaxID=617133 RepID=A0A853R428_9VIBR|nr:hypothetical protein [Vibrio ordalii]OEE33671.1 hypothetical protein A1QS_07435 [Vibrio ordalii FS-238]